MYSIVKYQPSEYGSYRFPAWAELLGILMGLLSCLMIPAGMLVAVLREEGSLWEVSLHHPVHLQPPPPVPCPRPSTTTENTGPTPHPGTPELGRVSQQEGPWRKELDQPKSKVPP